LDALNPGGLRKIDLNGSMRLISILVWLLMVAYPQSGSADEKNNCPECHEDYKERLSSTFNHKPFDDENCLACHIYHGFSNKSLLTGPVVEICSGCHKFMEDLAEDDIHAPLSDESSCLHCHSPHGAKYENLLLSPRKELCLECHDAPPGDIPGVHPPYADSLCTQCHDPHGSAFGANFLMPAGYMCIACHDTITAGFGPNEMHTADEINSCENCHEGHYTKHGNLLKKEPDDLCLGCHENLEESLAEKTPHSALDIEECTICHNPHFKKDSSSLIVKQPDLCFVCHSEIKNRIELKYHHAAVENEDCTSCHNPHIQFSGNDIYGLCSGCHDVADRDFQIKHLNLKTSNCAGCHDSHGSSSEFIFNDFLHSPFEAGECGSCHEAGMKLAALRSKNICLNCHDEPAANGAHSNVKMDNKTCVDCHSPHAAKKKYLLKN